MDDHPRWLEELIEERRRQDGQPTFYGTFNFAQWLRGLNAGRNPKDKPVQLRLT